LFLLAGDPGIGKSRLAHEAAARARDRGFKVAWGRCWEAGGAPTYWPWVQSLRALVRGAGSEQLRSQLGSGAPFVAQIVAEVAEVLLDVGPPPPAGAEAGRFRLFDAVATFVRNAGAMQPLMLVLDDLHAADAPSILLLRFVARELGDARVLVLGAYRDVELDRDHPLAVALAELSREPAARHVPLPGLAEAAVARLVQEITGVIPREGVVAAMHRCTEGNPLFVGEAARLLAAEGRLERADDPAGLRLAIPAGIREVIGRRVARLPEQCRRVLGLASMFGREFSLPALGQLSGFSTGELLDILDESIATGMVAAVPGAPGRLRFTHALIRDTLYDRFPGGERLRLHQRGPARLSRRCTRRIWARTWPSWRTISSRRRRAAASARRSAMRSGRGSAPWACWPMRRRSGCSGWPWLRSALSGRPGRTGSGAGCCWRWVMR
jgi:predicted ATPase